MQLLSLCLSIICFICLVAASFFSELFKLNKYWDILLSVKAEIFNKFMISQAIYM